MASPTPQPSNEADTVPTAIVFSSCFSEKPKDGFSYPEKEKKGDGREECILSEDGGDNETSDGTEPPPPSKKKRKVTPPEDERDEDKQPAATTAVTAKTCSSCSSKKTRDGFSSKEWEKLDGRCQDCILWDDDDDDIKHPPTPPKQRKVLTRENERDGERKQAAVPTSIEKTCSICFSRKPRDGFSPRQWKKSGNKRRCDHCLLVEHTKKKERKFLPPEDGLDERKKTATKSAATCSAQQKRRLKNKPAVVLCTLCKEKKPFKFFSRTERLKVKGSGVKCIACSGLRTWFCIQCKEEKIQPFFAREERRKGVDAKCRECLEQRPAIIEKLVCVSCGKEQPFWEYSKAEKKKGASEATCRECKFEQPILKS